MVMVHSLDCLSVGEDLCEHEHSMAQHSMRWCSTVLGLCGTACMTWYGGRVVSWFSVGEDLLCLERARNMCVSIA